MATVAVFIALGGGAYALSRGEVKSRNIDSNAVKSRHVAKNGIKGKDVAEKSLSGIGSGVMLASVDEIGGGVGSGLSAPSGPGHLFTDEHRMVAPQTFVATHLRVILSDSLSNGSVNVSLWKADGGNTALSCSVDVGENSCQSSEKVTVARGQVIALAVGFSTSDMVDAAVGWQATSR
jgi:hypothetical protein